MMDRWFECQCVYVALSVGGQEGLPVNTSSLSPADTSTSKLYVSLAQPTDDKLTADHLNGGNYSPVIQGLYVCSLLQSVQCLT